MFSILRFIFIVGVIFYYSPVRQQDEEMTLGSFLSSKSTEPADATIPASPSSADASDRLETMWRALPEGAKQAVIDKILTTSGLSAAESIQRDTLEPEDLRPAWRGTAPQPRS